MGKIIVYCREGCHYSNNTKNILTNLQEKINASKTNNLSITINIVPNIEFEKNKLRKQLEPIIGNYSTWPVIIYESTQGNKFFIGGDSNLNEIMNFVNSFSGQLNVNELLTCISSESLNKINPNLNDEGKRRLICNLLLIKNKIKF